MNKLLNNTNKKANENKSWITFSNFLSHLTMVFWRTQGSISNFTLPSHSKKSDQWWEYSPASSVACVRFQPTAINRLCLLAPRFFSQKPTFFNSKRPFPSCRFPLYPNKSSWKTFIRKWVWICMKVFGHIFSHFDTEAKDNFKKACSTRDTEPKWNTARADVASSLNIAV